MRMMTRIQKNRLEILRNSLRHFLSYSFMVFHQLWDVETIIIIKKHFLSYFYFSLHRWCHFHFLFLTQRLPYFFTSSLLIVHPATKTPTIVIIMIKFLITLCVINRSFISRCRLSLFQHFHQFTSKSFTCKRLKSFSHFEWWILIDYKNKEETMRSECVVGHLKLVPLPSCDDFVTSWLYHHLMLSVCRYQFI